MRNRQPKTRSRVDQLVARARSVMMFERLWPAAMLAAALVGLFVAISWLGVWVVAPRILRILGVTAFVAGLGLTGLLGWRAAGVSRSEALRRLDRDSGEPHRPLTTAEDRLANQGSDPMTSALWDLSRRRLDRIVAAIRVAPPSPRLADRDPFALRALALLGVVAAAFIAGPHKDGLIAAAFDWRGGGASVAGFRVDAWIDPPAYTGKPPVVLFAREAAGPTGQDIAVPVRSTVVVRSSGEGDLAITIDGALKPAPPMAVPSPGAAPTLAPSDRTEHRYVLDGNAHLTLSHDGAVLGAVALRAIPDLPPTIAMVGRPKQTARGALTLAYTIDDDYGVTSADASFSEPAFNGKPLAGRSLVPPPKLSLDLPPTPGALGTGQTTADLSDHPWAGGEVTMVLGTRDEGGNVGLGTAVRMVLPAHPFTNPLARALVEQRRNLVFNPDHRDSVGTALDALMIDPDTFGTPKAVYLGLYTARRRLEIARSDEDLVSLADYLWQMALRIEDGDLGQTARDLRAAEQALRDALKRGASAEEIKKLTADLRQQMDKYLAEMQQKNPAPDQQARMDPNAKSVSPDDLQKMMKRMEEMAQAGQTAEAQRMLDQLQTILENLKTAKNGAANRDANRDMNRQMSQLDKMTRDQQNLRDRTFKRGQDRHAPSNTGPGRQSSEPEDDQGDAAADQGRDGQPQPRDEAANEDLQGEQKGLRQQLDDLQKSMRQLGMKGEQGLADARQAMTEAEGALGQGAGGSRKAVEAQGRALAGLQKGADGLAQQMAQGQSDQSGEGEGNGGQAGQGNSGESENDPLGRRREGHGPMEAQGNVIDEGVAARAQRVLQELRRRLGNPNRPPEETDYLERLLNRN